MFLVLALLGSLASLAPRIGCRRFGRTRARITDPAPPSLLRYAGGKDRACFIGEAGMAEPEGFEPSIRLYNRITV